MTLLSRYLNGIGDRVPDPAPTALYAMLDHVATVSPSVAAAVVREFNDQRTNLKLIASENYCSLATQFAQGTLFTDKYAEGYPQHRFYAGCDNVDDVESEAAQLACDIFGAEHAYVQPHSGADANLLAYLAILATRVETKMLEKLGIEDPSKVERTDWTRSAKRRTTSGCSGSTITRAAISRTVTGTTTRASSSTRTRTPSTEDEAARPGRGPPQAKEIKPLVLLAGYSAYSRKIDFAKLREIADEVGAVLMVDMAHFAGLVAGKVFEGNYEPGAVRPRRDDDDAQDAAWSRGGMILCTSEFTEAVDKGCPIVLGGPCRTCSQRKRSRCERRASRASANTRSASSRTRRRSPKLPLGRYGRAHGWHR
jgi:glycine hydroxymethyltransferase